MTDPLRLTDHKDPVLAYISPAQRDLLQWLRQELPWGHILTKIKTQNGEPVGTEEEIKRTTVFGG